MNNEDKYERIIESAIEIISEKGFQKTVVSDIVRKAQVAQGTFYLYFSSKNALIPAIAERLLKMTLYKIKSLCQKVRIFGTHLKFTLTKLIKLLMNIRMY
jgi:transcriptional regulator, TetR family